MRIQRYQLPFQKEEIQLPKGSQILGMDAIDNHIWIHALMDETRQDCVPMHYHIFGTGQTMPLDMFDGGTNLSKEWLYLGSVVLHDWQSFHVFLKRVYVEGNWLHVIQP